MLTILATAAGITVASPAVVVTMKMTMMAMGPNKRLFTAALLLLSLALPTFADNQAGLAVDIDLPKATLASRFVNDGIDLGVAVPFHSHQSFLFDIETDRIAGQTSFSPAVGWEVDTSIKRFEPYAYFNAGSTTTVHQGSVFNSTIGQGLDVVLTHRYSLRFEHEFDWSKQMSDQWAYRYTILLVVHFR